MITLGVLRVGQQFEAAAKWGAEMNALILRFPGVQEMRAWALREDLVGKAQDRVTGKEVTHVCQGRGRKECLFHLSVPASVTQEL